MPAPHQNAAAAANGRPASPAKETWQSIHGLVEDGEDLLLYRHLLCSCLGGLDSMEERCMVRYLIRRSDIVLGVSS